MIIIPLLMFGLSAQPPTPDATKGQPVSIEAGCSGGVAGRSTTVRIDAEGRVSKGTRLAPIKVVGRIPREELRALSARLDAASFDGLGTLPRTRQVYDGVSCFITRRTTSTHTIQFPAGAATPDPALGGRYRATRGVLSDILKAADRVELNPQPIPPEGKR